MFFYFFLKTLCNSPHFRGTYPVNTATLPQRFCNVIFFRKNVLETLQESCKNVVISYSTTLQRNVSKKLQKLHSCNIFEGLRFESQWGQTWKKNLNPNANHHLTHPTPLIISPFLLISNAGPPKIGTWGPSA